MYDFTTAHSFGEIDCTYADTSDGIWARFLFRITITGRTFDIEESIWDVNYYTHKMNKCF